jgi:hypothetical protein
MFHNHQGEYYGFLVKLLNSCGVALVSNSRSFDKGNVVSALHPRQTTKECSIQRFFVLGMQEIWYRKIVSVKCTGVS